MSKVRFWIALALLVLAFLSDVNFNSIIDKVKNLTNKEKVISVEPKPDQVDITDTKPISDLITDKNDKARLAVFNYEFCNRLLTYKVTGQQLIDIYVNAGKMVFKDEFRDKYPTFGASLTKLFFDIIGEEDHMLTRDELYSIQKKFAGLSWNLSQ